MVMTFVLFTVKQSSQIMKIRPRAPPGLHKRGDSWQKNGVARCNFDSSKFQISASSLYPTPSWKCGPGNHSSGISHGQCPLKMRNLEQNDLISLHGPQGTWDGFITGKMLLLAEYSRICSY